MKKINKLISGSRVDMDFLFKKVLISFTLLTKFWLVVFMAKYIVILAVVFLSGSGKFFDLNFLKLIYYFTNFIEKIPFSEFFIGENFFNKEGGFGDKDSLRIFMYFSSIFFIVSYLIKKIIYIIKKSFFHNINLKKVNPINIKESVRKKFFISFFIISFIYWTEIIILLFEIKINGFSDMLIFLLFIFLFFLFLSFLVILYYTLDYFSQCIDNSLSNAKVKILNNFTKKDFVSFFIFITFILILFKFMILFAILLIFIGYSTFCFLYSKKIWKKLKRKNPKGIMILAPMADVTDKPFRRLISEIGKPDLLYTEFVAVNGLIHKEAKERLERQILSFEKEQKPIIAQIFGGSSENFYEASKICLDKNFDGIDINMGCPQKNIIAQGSGSALMKKENWEKAKDIFLETKRAVLENSKVEIPVSIKTRLGFSKIDFDWIKFILKLKPDAFIIHLRTQKEMSKVEAHWELMEKIKKIRDKISPKTILIGNGDVKNLKEAEEKVAKYGIDGVMIGRGIFENPWLFTGKNFEEFSTKEKLELVLKHTEFFEEEFGFTKENEKYKFKRGKNFNLLKKFFKIYVRGFDGAKELRIELMEAEKKKDIYQIIDNFLNK